MNKTSEKRETRTAGRILDDSSIVELVFDPVEKKTAFAAYRDGAWDMADQVSDGTEELKPYSPENNLIKHEAVLLPSEPTPCGSEEDVIEAVRLFIHTYVDLTPIFERIAVQYVLLSWVHDAFNELPYLRFQGDYGTGKTRALLVIGSIAYRPFFASGASTTSPIFHTLNAFQGTLIFDEADFRMSDEKAELVKILNNGTVRGMPVLRTMQNQKKEFNPAAFQVFGPKIVATRGVYDDKALESRFITEFMGGRPIRADIPLNLPLAFKGEALAIRNKLLMYRFENRHRTALDPSLADNSLEARQNQILIPLLSVTSDQVIRTEILENARTLGQSMRAERSLSLEGNVLAVLSALFNEHEGSLPLRLAYDAFKERYEEELGYAVTVRYFASIIRKKLMIRVVKSIGVMAIPRSEAARVTELAKRYGFDNGIALRSRDEKDEKEIPIPFEEESVF